MNKPAGATISLLLFGCGARTGLDAEIPSQDAASLDASLLDGSQERSALLAVGGTEAFYQTADGGIFAWGGSWDGVLNSDAGLDANAAVIPHPTPMPVPSLGYAKAMAPIGVGNCILDTGGQVSCWGWNGLGAVDGVGSKGKPPPGVVVVTHARSLSGARFHCARLDNNSVQCWGYPVACEGPAPGQLAPQPPHRRTDLEPLANLSIGDEGLCGMDGTTVRCCGSNSVGQLGDGTTNDRNALAAVKLPAGARSVSYGWTVTPCAVMLDSTVECWGWNDLGQVGDGTIGGIRPLPVPVAGLKDVDRVAVGGRHSCALLRDHTARCWGGNLDGEIGDGTTTNRPSPVPLRSPTGYGNWLLSDIQTGGGFTCAVDMDGKVWCWGRNEYGQLGDGTTVNRTVPTRVVGLP